MDAPKIETAETRNASMKGQPAPKPYPSMIIQQPQAVGDKVAPAVKG